MAVIFKIPPPQCPTAVQTRRHAQRSACPEYVTVVLFVIAPPRGAHRNRKPPNLHGPTWHHHGASKSSSILLLPRRPTRLMIFLTPPPTRTCLRSASAYICGPGLWHNCAFEYELRVRMRTKNRNVNGTQGIFDLLKPPHNGLTQQSNRGRELRNQRKMSSSEMRFSFLFLIRTLTCFSFPTVSVSKRREDDRSRWAVSLGKVAAP